MNDYSNKPTWPYVFGTFGASMFALGMLLVLAVFVSSSGSPDLGRVGFMLAGTGSVLLGVTWTQLLRVNQAGIGQIAACFLLPVAMIFLATRSGYDDLQTAVLILCLSLCAFALAHVFIPRLTGVRWGSVISLVGLVPTTLAVGGKLDMRGTWQLLMMLGLGGLCAVGVLLAVGMSRLKEDADDPYRL